MVKYFFFLFLLLSQFSYSQTNYELFKGEPVKTVVPTRLSEPYFCEYRDSSSNPLRLVYKNGFSSYSSPEDLLLSAYSGTASGITNVPVYGGTKPDTSNRNGLMLIHKLTFFWQGTEVAVVKYAEMKDSIVGKPYSIQLQRQGSIWKQVNLTEIKYIENTMLYIRTKIFWELYNKRSSDILGVNDVKKVVKDEEGLLNISLLSDFINQERRKNSTVYGIICDN